SRAGSAPASASSRSSPTPGIGTPASSAPAPRISSSRHHPLIIQAANDPHGEPQVSDPGPRAHARGRARGVPAPDAARAAVLDRRASAPSDRRDADRDRARRPDPNTVGLPEWFVPGVRKAVLSIVTL